MNERLGIWVKTKTEDDRPRYTTELTLIPKDHRVPPVQNTWIIEEGVNGETIISNFIDGTLEWKSQAVDRSIYQQIALMDKVFSDDSEVVPTIMWMASKGVY